MKMAKRPEPLWARILIGLASVAIALYGITSIVTQHHIGQTRGGKWVESTGVAAIGMGVFFLGGALLMGSLVLPNKLRLSSIVAGFFCMVGGVFLAIFLR